MPACDEEGGSPASVAARGRDGESSAASVATSDGKGGDPARVAARKKREARPALLLVVGMGEVRPTSLPVAGTGGGGGVRPRRCSQQRREKSGRQRERILVERRQVRSGASGKGDRAFSVSTRYTPFWDLRSSVSDYTMIETGPAVPNAGNVFAKRCNRETMENCRTKRVVCIFKTHVAMTCGPWRHGS